MNFCYELIFDIYEFIRFSNKYYLQPLLIMMLLMIILILNRKDSMITDITYPKFS